MGRVSTSWSMDMGGTAAQCSLETTYGRPLWCTLSAHYSALTFHTSHAGGLFRSMSCILQLLRPLETDHAHTSSRQKVTISPLLLNTPLMPTIFTLEAMHTSTPYFQPNLFLFFPFSLCYCSSFSAPAAFLYPLQRISAFTDISPLEAQ